MTVQDPIPHGTYSGRKYWKCGCEHCGLARRHYQNRVSRLKAYGRWDPYVDVESVRTHIQDLLDQGWYLAQIAHEADVDRETLYKILKGTTRLVKTTTADRLWPVWGSPPPLVNTNLKVPSWGAYRRVRLLQAAGMNYRRIAIEAGVSLTTINRLTAVTARPNLRGGIHHKIAQAYDRLAHKPIEHPDPVSMSVAKAAGYSTPAGWETSWLDMSPQELAEHLRCEAAKMTRAEHNRCYKAVKYGGELSPLAKAGAKAYTNPKYVEGVQS